MPGRPCRIAGLDLNVRGVDARRVGVGLGDANEFGQLLDNLIGRCELALGDGGPHGK